MPELPEVETVRRQLHARLSGAVIQDVALIRSGREQPAGVRFVEAIRGKTIERIERRAKLLVWRFSDGSAMTAHLKMTGRFVFVPVTYAAAKHDRMLFSFSNDERVVWGDVRQFGYVAYHEPGEVERVLLRYGPEPLEIETEDLAHVLRRSSARTIKATLLDQTVLAGVGNIYADEALYRAGIRPTRKTRALTSEECVMLAREVQTVLLESIAQRGTSANDYVDTAGERGGFLGLLRVYGRAGEPCRSCATPIKKIVVAQRGTHYCPVCQKR